MEKFNTFKFYITFYWCVLGSMASKKLISTIKMCFKHVFETITQTTYLLHDLTVQCENISERQRNTERPRNQTNFS